MEYTVFTVCALHRGGNSFPYILSGSLCAIVKAQQKVSVKLNGIDRTRISYPL